MTTRRPNAPMPDTVRHLVRAGHHPARAVECPWCRAAPHTPCTTKSGRRRLTDAPVHPQRTTAWVQSVACCPTCQVEPGTPCHTTGEPLVFGAVHDARRDEADVTA
ncbi:zinc finger domain-containing protein [Streptomyces phytophilus]|uniref:zinc finger domain-containing protein n=1 Tax=Streptomyces phytophilus TaxID=722715 RepID=UPI0015F01423|nr:hypothetical protein [Streptomyces phytophilus]